MADEAPTLRYYLVVRQTASQQLQQCPTDKPAGLYH